MQSRIKDLLIVSVLFLGLLLAACGPASVAEPTNPPEPTPLPAVDTVEPTVAFTATSPPATPTDIPTPTEEPVVDNCVDCHTDKDQLVDTADPVLEVISENEGEG